MTPDNLFVQLNQKAVNVSEKLEVTINYQQVVVSMGCRKLPQVTVNIDIENRQLIFIHKAEKFARRAVDEDLLYAAVLEKEQQSLSYNSEYWEIS